MKRGIAVLVSVGALFGVAYFTASKWAIRHEALTFEDPSRDNRPVTVDVAVRWDKKVQANAGMIKLPVAVLNHGNTVKNTEYSFLANIFAARGYLDIMGLGRGSRRGSFRGRYDARGTTYTNALRPVMARPVTSEFISRVPSYE